MSPLHQRRQQAGRQQGCLWFLSAFWPLWGNQL